MAPGADDHREETAVGDRDDGAAGRQTATILAAVRKRVAYLTSNIFRAAPTSGERRQTDAFMPPFSGKVGLGQVNGLQGSIMAIMIALQA